MAILPGLKDFSLSGNRAVVLGAEHPLGRAAAIAMVEAGAKILLASQDAGVDTALHETAKAVEGAGQKNPPIQVQRASVRADLSATADLAVSKLGGLDILVTALDSPFYAPFEETDDSTYDRVMDDNLKSVWTACQEFGRVMLQRGGGAIVVISNLLGERGVPNATAYCTAKGAIRNLVRALGLEWARRNLRINLLECSWLELPKRAETAGDEFSERLVKYLPYRRLLKPDEIAGALLYLASSASGFVTGEALAVDGGLLCRV